MNNDFARIFAAAAALAATAVFAEEAPAAETAAAEAPAAEAPSDRSVAVRIDGVDAVYDDEVDAIIDFALEARKGEIPPEHAAMARAQMRRGLVEQLAVTSLLLREAEAAGVAAADEDRAALLAEIGVSSLEEASKTTGMPVKMLEEAIVVNKLVSSKTNGIPAPTDEEVRAKFDEIVAAHPEAVNVPERVTASHILVKVDPGATPEKDAEAKAKIEALRERALAGEDFAALARENSDCPSASRGGDLGQFGHGQMVKEFDEAAFSQEVGKVGDVVKTQFGYHVVLVTDKQEAKTVDFADVKDEIAFGISEERKRKAVGDFVQSVRSAAKIEFPSAAVVSDAVEIAPPEDPAPEPRRLPEWAE